jgi:hypothetical protein
MSPLRLFLVFRAFTASNGIFNDTSSGTNTRMRDKAEDIIQPLRRIEGYDVLAVATLT